MNRILVWTICLAPLYVSGVVISQSPDPWRWGTVAAVSFAILCEVWHGYCQHSRSVTELHPGQRPRDDKLPWADRFFARDHIGMSQGRIGEDGSIGEIEHLVAVPWFGRRALAHSALVRAVGRLTLAGFVIAGFAVGQFEIPWVTAT